MMYKWTDDMVRFMKDASSRTSYFEDLASIIYQEVGIKQNVCDAGCGLGQLANELASFYTFVEAVDINHNAVINIENPNGRINIVEADLMNYVPKKKYDLMVFNYFGDIDQIMRIKDRCCEGTTVIIKRKYKKHRFSFSDNPIGSFNRQSAVDYLNKNNIAFRELDFTHEFGQPFRSIDDAVRFFEIYSHDADRALINEKNVRDRLTKTDDKEFPFYMNHIKESSILIL